MREHTYFLIDLCCIAIGAVGIGCAVMMREKCDKICRRLDIVIDDISDDIDVDVSEKVINKAIEKAVDKSVDKAVDKSVNSIIKSTNKDISEKVNLAMKSTYSDIQKMCNEKAKEEISKINSVALTNSIREEAKEKMLEKFDGKLDDILEQFNTDLYNVSKIYASITKKITDAGSNNLRIKFE